MEGKVELLPDHPKLPRLLLAFSGRVEGLHGLTLGGPGRLVSERAPTAARGRHCNNSPFGCQPAWKIIGYPSRPDKHLPAQ